MRYVIRAVKYYIYIMLLLAVMLGVLTLLKVVDGNISTMFRNGTDSLWQIAIMFAVISAIYPAVGYVKRQICISGPLDAVKDGIVKSMKEHGYNMEKTEEGKVSFRRDSFFQRLTRTFEDRITVYETEDGIFAEGLRKDVVRVVMSLEQDLGTPEGLD